MYKCFLAFTDVSKVGVGKGDPCSWSNKCQTRLWPLGWASYRAWEVFSFKWIRTYEVSASVRVSYFWACSLWRKKTEKRRAGADSCVFWCGLQSREALGTWADACECQHLPLYESVPLSVGNSAVGGWRSGWGQGAAAEPGVCWSWRLDWFCCSTLLVTVLIASVGEALPEIMQSIPKDSESRLYGVEACGGEGEGVLGKNNNNKLKKSNYHIQRVE